LRPEQRKAPRYCKLAPALDERLCRLSNQTGISINALLITAVAHLLDDAERILGPRINRT
jgi:hypothetical protein